MNGEVIGIAGETVTSSLKLIQEDVAEQ